MQSTSFTSDRNGLGSSLYQLLERLYPICRSITGDGVRETLKILAEYIPLVISEVPSGERVFDWEVPKEWNIRDAYIKDRHGNRVVDFRKSNLHVVNYSIPVQKIMPLHELKEHLFTLPEHPDWIPYRTSYYSESWGFCLSHNQLARLADSEYEVCIDSTLAAGHLTYAEYFLAGQSSDEVLIYTHTCHPSLCNDNLSGIALTTHLARYLSGRQRRYSYRFVFAPGTIGSITWLSRNERLLPGIRHGLVIALVGDPGSLTYKCSRYGNADIDRVATQVLKERGEAADITDFSPYGYDERQFGSPGINLPLGRLTRSPNGAYPEYHTSADNLELVTADKMADSFDACAEILDMLERNYCYRNTAPKCEPQLGKRGLYRKTGGQKDIGDREFALLWVLNQSDGGHSLLDIAQRSGLKFAAVANAADELLEAGLLELCPD